MNARRFLIILFPMLLVGAIAVGYKVRQLSCRRLTEIRQEEIVRQSEELMRSYLQGDVDHARECLQKNARLLEEATVLEPIGRALLLHLTYFHLYVLEKRVGNEAAAEAALIKAQYWVLKKAELMGVNVEKAMQDIRDFTGERIFEYIDDLDRRHNNGKEPAYIRDLREKGNVVPEQGDAAGADK